VGVKVLTERWVQTQIGGKEVKIAIEIHHKLAGPRRPNPKYTTLGFYL